MVGGAHGQVGQHALQHVEVVRGPDNVSATILPLRVVEVIVLEETCGRGLVTQQSVQV